MSAAMLDKIGQFVAISASPASPRLHSNQTLSSTQDWVSALRDCGRGRLSVVLPRHKSGSRQFLITTADMPKIHSRRDCGVDLFDVDVFGIPLPVRRSEGLDLPRFGGEVRTRLRSQARALNLAHTHGYLGVALLP